MRIERRNRWLALALALALAAHFALRPNLPDASAAGPLFPSFDALAVTRLLVERGVEPSVERIELFRVEDARGVEQWVVRQAFAHPAASWAVEQVLARVTALRRSDRVSGEASSRALFGVDESGVRVLLGGDGGTVLAAFVQGESREPGTGDARGSYVRPVTGDADEDAVYRAPLLAPLEPRAARWLDTRLLPVAAEDVVWLRLRLGARGPELAVRRAADGTWRMTSAAAGPGAAGQGAADELGPEVPAVRVERALELATSVYFEQVLGTGRVGEAAGIEVPGLVLELACRPEAGTPPVAFVLAGEPDAAPGSGTAVPAGSSAPNDSSASRRALRGSGPGAAGPDAAGVLGGESGWVVAVPRASLARLEEALRSLAESAQKARSR